MCQTLWSEFAVAINMEMHLINLYFEKCNCRVTFL